jgi:hypothetical protein
MTEAAAAWLEALDPEQRAKAALSFADSEERTSWAYFPRLTKGLPLLEMDARQQKLAHALVAEALSFQAYATVVTVMASESLVPFSDHPVTNSGPGASKVTMWFLTSPSSAAKSFRPRRFL